MKSVCARLAQRIHAVCGDRVELNLETASVEEVLASCEAGLKALEDNHRDSQSSFVGGQVVEVPHVSLVEVDHTDDAQMPPLEGARYQQDTNHQNQ